MERYFVGLYDVKRFAPGRITQAASKGLISHDCTSLGGNSGSPLVSLSQKGAVGLHFSGTYGVNNTAVSVRTIKALLANPHAVSVSSKIEAEAHPESVDGVHKPADLAGRDGFDPMFLGKALATPWPALPAAIVQDLASPSDATDTQPDELRYTHFGLMFSQTLKLPIVTAVNIDGLASVRIKRDSDKWFFDGRIPLDKQHGQKAYADRAIDRGHMVRREDPNWGSEAARANDDTFHYTNAAPQHALLNQGKTLWQGLENYILDSARTEGFRANVFTGPVHDPEDPTLDEDGMTVPLEFWKVVVMTAAGGKALHATAYLLSQGQLIRKLLEDRSRSEAVEGFVLGPYRTFQIAIADLEKATGYDFHHLREADPLAKTKAGQEALEQAAPLVVPLESPSDLIL
jgi:endonuclease G